MSSSKEDIVKLIDTYKPLVLAFQETFYGNDFMSNVNGYHGMCKQGHFNPRFHEIVAMCVHKSCPFEEVRLETDFQAVAVRVHVHEHRAVTFMSLIW